MPIISGRVLPYLIVLSVSSVFNRNGYSFLQPTATLKMLPFSTNDSPGRFTRVDFSTNTTNAAFPESITAVKWKSIRAVHIDRNVL